MQKAFFGKLYEVKTPSVPLKKVLSFMGIINSLKIWVKIHLPKTSV
jgi:hypothetical protein